MGTTALKSKPTIRSSATGRSQHSDKSLSPVSPIDSNGESWKYPPSANGHPKKPETPHEKPLNQVPARTRLSRPFDQPYPMQPSSHHQPSPPHIDVPTHATLKRADSHLRHQPAQVPRRKPAPRLSITIPAPAHQAKRQQERNPNQQDQLPAERSDRRQRGESRKQRSAFHQKWDPLKELALQQGTAQKDHRRGRRRSRDLERQDEGAGVAKGSKHDAMYSGNRACFFFLVVMMIIVVVIIVVVAKRAHQSGHQG